MSRGIREFFVTKRKSKHCMLHSSILVKRTVKQISEQHHDAFTRVNQFFYPSLIMVCFSEPSPIPRKVITIHTLGVKQTPSPKDYWELLSPSSFAGTTNNELRFWTNQQRTRTTNSGKVLIISSYSQNVPHNQFTPRFSVDSVSLPSLMVFSSD